MAGKHFSIQLHIIWSTSHRQPWIAKKWRAPLYQYLEEVVAAQGGKLLSAGGTSDHVHACLVLPSTVTVAGMVSVMKTQSARWLYECYLTDRVVSWQRGYGAFSVSKSAETNICRFIAGQEEHHRMWSFQDEFLSLLRLHRIEYDEQHVWD